MKPYKHQVSVCGILMKPNKHQVSVCGILMKTYKHQVSVCGILMKPYKHQVSVCGILMKLYTLSVESWQNQTSVEWGCPNGTKYPPRQPIQTPQVMCLKPFYLTAGVAQCIYRRTDGRTERFQYTPLNFVAGGIIILTSYKN